MPVPSGVVLVGSWFELNSSDSCSSLASTTWLGMVSPCPLSAALCWPRRDVVLSASPSVLADLCLRFDS